MEKKYSCIFIIAFILSLQSLFAQSSHKYFVTFMKGNNKFQYYIKPINFSGNLKTSKVIIDLTFIPNDSVTINFSILYTEKYKEVDSLVIKSSNNKLVVRNCELLYYEKWKKQIETRFTSSCKVDNLSLIFSDEFWDISLYDKKGVKYYSSNIKNRKIIKKINEDLFLFYINE